MDLSPLFISIKTALFATAFAFVLGILAAYFVLKRQRFKSLADAVFTLPMVLPPTVVGFFLLLAFGKNSWIGQLLETMNLSVIFSWGGTVIASTVVAFPLMYRTALGAFEQVDENLFAAARTLGISETAIFMKILYLIVCRVSLLERFCHLPEQWANSVQRSWLPAIFRAVLKRWRWRFIQQLKAAIGNWLLNGFLSLLPSHLPPFYLSMHGTAG